MVSYDAPGITAQFDGAVRPGRGPAIESAYANRDLGSEISPREQQTPQALASLQRAEIEKWWPIIKAANIKGE
jgi:hypothetical protein